MKAMPRNQRVAWGIVGITLGLVVGLWMALVLSGLSATEEPVGDVDELSRELTRLQEEVDALASDIEDARGQAGATEGSLASTVQLVGEVQAQLDDLLRDVDGVLVLVEGQDSDLVDLRSELERTQDDLDTTREQLVEALLQLEYAKGRLDGTQPSANISFGELADVLDELATAISLMEETQEGLSEAVAGLLGALGTGRPDGMALYSPHLAHWESPLLNFSCSMCHNVDLEGDLNAYEGQLYFDGRLASEDFRVQINKDRVCSDCHDWFPLGEMDPGDKERSCTIGRCHDDWREEMDSPFVNEDVVTVDDCLLCHGGQPFYPR